MSMTAVPPNQSPNDGPLGQPISRLDELLADRAAAGLGESEQAELCRLLTAAGKAEDASLDLAAAACDRAFNPGDCNVELPASLLASLDREGEAWCGGVHSHDDVAGRIHEPTPFRSDVGRGHAVRTPFKRFTREYGGWLAAAACLCFGVYTWNNRTVHTTVIKEKDTAMVDPAPPVLQASLFEPVVDRLNRWFNKGSKIDLVALGSATPEASTDVAVGQVMWNPEEGSGVLQIKGDDAKAATSHSYRVSVRCPKSGKQVTVETGAVTLHPGQKDVVVPINPTETLRGAASFVVSVCSQGPMGVSQSEGVVGIGGPMGDSMVQPSHEGG